MGSILAECQLKKSHMDLNRIKFLIFVHVLAFLEAPGASRRLPGNSPRLPEALHGSPGLPDGSWSLQEAQTLVFSMVSRGAGAEGTPGRDDKKHRSGRTKQVAREPRDSGARS